MKSTGEVMGLDQAFGTAFAKSQEAAFGPLPTQGTVFVSVANRDKRHVIFPVKRLADLGFELVATAGTASVLRRNGVKVTEIRKHTEGPGPHGEKTVVQAIVDGEIDLVFNTPQGSSPGGSPRLDGWEIRTAAVVRSIPCITTVQGLAAAVQGIEAMRAQQVGVRSLQSWASEFTDPSLGLTATAGGTDGDGRDGSWPALTCAHGCCATVTATSCDPHCSEWPVATRRSCTNAPWPHCGWSVVLRWVRSPPPWWVARSTR